MIYANIKVFFAQKNSRDIHMQRESKLFVY